MVAAMVAGVAVRLAPVLAGHGTTRFTFVDSASYVRVAADLGAWWSPDAATLDDSLLRTFGYPVFVWLASFGSLDPTLVVIAQVLLGGAVNVALTAAIARRVMGPSTATATTAAVAAWIVALEPASVGHSLLVAAETLAVTALLVTTLAALRAIDASDQGDDRGTMRWCAATGALLALTAMVRPEWVFAVPIVVAVVAVGRSRRTLRAAAALLAGSAVVLAPWSIRNATATGDPLLFSTATGQNVFVAGVAAEATDRGELIVAPWRSGDWMQGLEEAAARVERTHRPPDAHDVVRRDARWSSVGRQLLLEHPVGHARVAAASLIRTALAPSHDLVVTAASASPGGTIDRALGVGAVLVLAVMYAGFARGVPVVAGRGRRAAVALVPVAAFLILTAGPHSYSRFRVMAVPAIAVTAGAGVNAAWAKRATGATRTGRRSGETGGGIP